MALITLTTDFGTSDWFAGTLHGVILGLAPQTRIVDITHGIPPGNLRAAAFALRCAAPYFPDGTIHVAVVDPGVGGPRPAIALQTPTAWFVGPDNGLLSWAVGSQPIRRIHRIENRSLLLPEVSRTFHGRDVFAPVAAYLARGGSPSMLGPSTTDFRRLPWPEPSWHRGGLRGEVVHLDRFGNAITNLTGDHLGRLADPIARAGQPLRRCPLVPCYAAVAAGQPAAVLGSTGLLEIAVNQGSAATRLHIAVGDTVRLCRAPRSARPARTTPPGSQIR